MAYIGKSLVGILNENKVVDSMTGDGSDTTLTLSRTPGSVNNVEVFIDGIYQTPDVEYTLAGDTITFTSAPEVGVTVVAVSGADSTIINPAAGSITGAKIVDNAITGAKVAALSASKLTGALPALSGSGLTGLPAANLTGALPAIDGSALTGLPAANLTGALPAIDGSALTGLSGVTKSASDPLVTTNPSGGVGQLFLNTTSGEMYACTDATTDANVWTNVGPGTGDITPLPAFYGPRGLTGGGDIGVVANYAGAAKIEYVTIQTAGNAAHFGNFYGPGRDAIDSTSNGTRGLWLGGNKGANAMANDIDYVTCATIANAADFGDLSLARQGVGGAANVTRAVTAGGYVNGGGTRDTMDYVTVATLGTALVFGNASTSRWGNHGVASDTRIVFSTGGGNAASLMDYITIATLGDATTFGNFISMSDGGFCGDGTRGVHIGGANIEYITIATPGNATNFGTMTTYGSNPYGGSVCGDGSRGVHIGGTINSPQASHVNMDYITIATTGNSTTFGNAFYSRYSHQSCSGG